MPRTNISLLVFFQTFTSLAKNNAMKVFWQKSTRVMLTVHFVPDLCATTPDILFALNMDAFQTKCKALRIASLSIFFKSSLLKINRLPEFHMKKIFTLMVVLASAVFCNPSFAGADDAKWINQCVADNKDGGQSAETVQKYCQCMNEKMPDGEEQSISQWEKTHKAENEACSAAAGWK